MWRYSTRLSNVLLRDDASCASKSKKACIGGHKHGAKNQICNYFQLAKANTGKAIRYGHIAEFMNA